VSVRGSSENYLPCRAHAQTESRKQCGGRIITRTRASRSASRSVVLELALIHVPFLQSLGKDTSKTMKATTVVAGCPAGSKGPGCCLFKLKEDPDWCANNYATGTTCVNNACGDDDCCVPVKDATAASAKTSTSTSGASTDKAGAMSQEGKGDWVQDADGKWKNSATGEVYGEDKDASKTTKAAPVKDATAASAKTSTPAPAKLPTMVATLEVGGTTEAELVKDSALQTKLVTGFANVVGVDAGDVTITRIGDTDVSRISRRLLQRQLSLGVSVSFEVVTTSSLEAAALKSKVVATPMSKITASFEAAGAIGMTAASKFTAVVTVVDAKKNSDSSGDTAAIAGGVVGGVVLLMAVYVCGKMHGQEQPKGSPSHPTGAVVQSTEMVMVPAAAPAAEA